MHDPQNPSHNHYDAIFLFDKSGQLLDKDRQSPTRQQLMVPHHEYKVIDLTDEYGTTLMQQHVSFPYYKNDMQFPTLLFINISPEGVDQLR